jgi:hypothetical protein
MPQVKIRYFASKMIFLRLNVPQNALTIFEETHRYTPKVMYFYKPPSGKFQSWIIVENEK